MSIRLFSAEEWKREQEDFKMRERMNTQTRARARAEVLELRPFLGISFFSFSIVLNDNAMAMTLQGWVRTR